MCPSSCGECNWYAAPLQSSHGTQGNSLVRPSDNSILDFLVCCLAMLIAFMAHCRSKGAFLKSNKLPR